MRKQYSLIVMALFLVTGCASNPNMVSKKTGGPLETLLWSSQDSRPKWTIEEPDVDGNIMVFVGLSNKYATEKGSRQDAMRNATSNVVKHLGTMAKEKYERVSVSFGLESSVIDPTGSARVYEKQLAANVVKHLKSTKWYLEQWNTPTGIGWKAFVLATIPLDSINESFKRTAKTNLIAAKRRAKDAADEYAKKQADKAVDFWGKMVKEGVVPKD